MLKTLTKIMMAYAFLSLSLNANAGLFQFSYDFNDGSSVIGTLTGEANGLYIDNVDNVTLNMNGIDINSQIWDVAYDSTYGWDNTIDAIVSFDANLNNFLFIDTNYPDSYNYSAYFLMVNASGSSQSNAYDANNGYYPGDYPTNASAWSISEVNSVPEPSTIALMGLGLIGMAASRRRMKK